MARGGPTNLIPVNDKTLLAATLTQSKICAHQHETAPKLDWNLHLACALDYLSL
jgi:hypothetical protein